MSRPDGRRAPAAQPVEHRRVNEQALLYLSNREIADASRWETFHCKIANNRVFL